MFLHCGRDISVRKTRHDVSAEDHLIREYVHRTWFCPSITKGVWHGKAERWHVSKYVPKFQKKQDGTAMTELGRMSGFHRRHSQRVDWDTYICVLYKKIMVVEVLHGQAFGTAIQTAYSNGAMRRRRVSSSSTGGVGDVTNNNHHHHHNNNK